MSSVDPSQPDQSDQPSQPEVADSSGQPGQPGEAAIVAPAAQGEATATAAPAEAAVEPAATAAPAAAPGESTATAAPVAAAAAGWYADPSGTGGTRWWDGTAWTQNVQPPAPATPPPPPPQPAYPPAPGYGSAPGYGTTPGSGTAPAYGVAPGYAPAYQGGYVQPRSVGFGEAVRRAFAGWGDYSGRATVAEYWWFVLFDVLVALPLYLLFVVVLASSFSTATNADGTASVTSTGLSAVGILLAIVMVVAYVVLVLAGLALSVRRLHDSDKSGWWLLISFVPFGSLVLLVFYILPGTPGPNRWGPVPQ